MLFTAAYPNLTRIMIDNHNTCPHVHYSEQDNKDVMAVMQGMKCGDFCKIADVIDNLFRWGHTPQGRSYWETLFCGTCHSTLQQYEAELTPPDPTKLTLNELTL